MTQPVDRPKRGGSAAAPEIFRTHRLQPFQRQAIEAVISGDNVIVAAPTGAGKTLVADWAIENILAQNRHAIYASPVKALSNQKYRDFRKELGADRVGLVTGDVVINPEAPALVMTTEIFQSRVLENPDSLEYCELVVFDEIHYLGDQKRGTHWEESIILAPEQLQIVALSATLPNLDSLNDWLKKVRGKEVVVVRERERPVPLFHSVWIPSGVVKGRAGQGHMSVPVEAVPSGWLAPENLPLQLEPGYIRSPRLDRASLDLVAELRARDLMPAIYFCTSRQDCERFASLHANDSFVDDDARADLVDRFDELRVEHRAPDVPATRAVRDLVGKGVAYHHAGMMPSLKPIVEVLFNEHLLRILFATETFAIGVNMPARAVCFHYLAKYDGAEMRCLRVREYSQMAGRAGRLNMDPRGEVISIVRRREVHKSDLIAYQEGRVEPIRSFFDPGYRSLLCIVFGRQWSTEKLWSASFAAVDPQMGSAEKADHLAAINARWDVLERLQYIRQGELTEKGRICMAAKGYEIELVEALDGGLIEACSPVQIAALVSSIACDRQFGLKVRDHDILPEAWRCNYEHHLAELAQVERESGVRGTIQQVDFTMVPLAARWAEGAGLDEVLDLTKGNGLSVGDFVMITRQAIQAIRGLDRGLLKLPKYASARRCLREAVARMMRDEVDPRCDL